MTGCQEIQARLSHFVDGDLADVDRAAIEAHVGECDACRGVLQDLERLRRAAATLGPIAPPDHVWLEVAGQVQIESGQAAAATKPRHTAALGQWLGLAAALVVITLGAYFVMRQSPTPPASPSGNVQASGSVEAITEELALATQHYENAITQLETLVKSGDGTLDPSMAAVLQQNIKTIDTAIAESRTALDQNPTSEPARESLFDALRRKVGVLQATVTLMNEMRKGDQAAAAEAAAAFGKKS
jgi:anti-sigma factor RsiW